MKWFDYILTFVSLMCTVASIIGAYKANKYYKKSKNLTIYANMNSAYIECNQIIYAMTEMLKWANSKKKRGVNYQKELSQLGETIKSGMNRIRENCSSIDLANINSILNSEQTNVERYIDSFITGSILFDQQFIVDDDFYQCQEAFLQIQVLLKKRMEESSEAAK